jgi:hypothetical protein
MEFLQIFYFRASILPFYVRNTALFNFVLGTIQIVFFKQILRNYRTDTDMTFPHLLDPYLDQRDLCPMVFTLSKCRTICCRLVACMYVGLAVALYYGVTYLWNAGRTYFAGRTALADPPLFCSDFYFRGLFSHSVTVSYQ